MPQDISPFASGAAAILVGFLASPLLEYFKSWLTTKSVRAIAKRDLVAKLRVAFGYLDAFKVHVDHAVGHNPEAMQMQHRHLDSWKAMQTFDLSPIVAMIQDLAKLELDISSKSAVSQSLVKRILLLLSGFENLKTLSPTFREGLGPRKLELQHHGLDLGAVEAVKYARRIDTDLRRFVSGPYSKILGINGLSFVLDSEVFAHDVTMMAYDENESAKKLAASHETYKQLRAAPES